MTMLALFLLQKTVQIRDQFFLYMDPIGDPPVSSAWKTTTKERRMYRETKKGTKDFPPPSLLLHRATLQPNQTSCNRSGKKKSKFVGG
jgi:hypothetical protein